MDCTRDHKWSAYPLSYYRRCERLLLTTIQTLVLKEDLWLQPSIEGDLSTAALGISHTGGLGETLIESG